MLGRLDDVGRPERRQAGVAGAEGSVSHKAVEEGPERAKDLGRRAARRLLEGHVVLLVGTGWWGVSFWD